MTKRKQKPALSAEAETLTSGLFQRHGALVRLAPSAGADGEAGSETSTERVVSFTASVGADVIRYDWRRERKYIERLSLEPAHVDVSRAGMGVMPLLWDHSRWQHIGRVTGLEVSASAITGNGKVAQNAGDAVERCWSLIDQDMLNGVSIGYDVEEYTHIPAEARDGMDVYLATKWQILEVSAVTIPADPNAVMDARSMAADRAFPTLKTRSGTILEEIPMPKTPTQTDPAIDGVDTPAPAPIGPDVVAIRQAEIKRQNHIRESAQSLGLSEADILPIVESDVTIEQASVRLIELATSRSPKPTPGVGVPQGGQDEDTTRREALVTSLLVSGGVVKSHTDASRQYAGARLSNVVNSILEARGVRVRTFDAFERYRAAASLMTGDLPIILGETARRALRASYEAAPRTFQAFTRSVTVPDFKAVKRAQMSNAPSLLEVPEGAEVTHGALADGAETFALATYARKLVLSRQAITNDDLDALIRLPQKFGQAAADLESDVVYNSVLIGNPTMSDGVAVFAAGHSNLAGSATGVTQTSLTAADTAIREQRAFGPTVAEANYLNLTPKFLIVPPSQRLAALKEVTSVQPNKSSDVNPFMNQLEVISEGRLTGSSWYMMVEPTQIDTIEVAYLDGANGAPIIYEEETTSPLGMTWTVVHDFAAAAIDYRGMYKTPLA